MAQGSETRVVLLWQLLALEVFWETLFPGKPMRWISLDQKPSWFKNAGHTSTFSQRGKIPTVKEKLLPLALAIHFGLLMDTRWRRGSQPNALCLHAFCGSCMDAGASASEWFLSIIGYGGGTEVDAA